MGINFRKRIRLGKFINLNVGKQSAGLSFGIPGARFTVNTSGRKQASIGIPGTGLSYTKSFGTKSKKSKAKSSSINASSDIDKQIAVNDYQNALYALSHIHNEAYDFFNFDQLPIEYVTREIGPRQKQALVAIENYKPNFFDKLFKREENEMEELQEALYQAIEEDDNNREVHRVDSELAKQLQRFEPKAMDEFIRLVGGFDCFSDDITSLSYYYKMNVDEASAIVVDVYVNLQEDIIDNVVEFDKTGKYTNKKLTKTNLNERFYAYLCSLSLGVATEACAITPLTKAYVNVYDSSVSSATGLKTERCILAGEFDEKQLMQYDYETLNPIAVIEALPVDINFTARNGFKEVKPIDFK